MGVADGDVIEVKGHMNVGRFEDEQMARVDDFNNISNRVIALIGYLERNTILTNSPTFLVICMENVRTLVGKKRKQRKRQNVSL